MTNQFRLLVCFFFSLFAMSFIASAVEVSKKLYLDKNAGSFADIQIEFEDWDRLFLVKPAEKISSADYQSPMPLQNIEDIIRNFKGNKESAVVIMGKAWSLSNEEQKRQDLERLEEILKNLGIKRIVFEQACGDCDGLPILKSDEAFLKSSGVKEEPSHP